MLAVYNNNNNILMKSAIFKFTCKNVCELNLPDIRRCFDGDPGQVYKNDLSVSKKEFEEKNKQILFCR